MKRQLLPLSILAVVVAATLAACGGGGGDGNATRACNFTADAVCSAVTGPANILDAAGYTEATCANGSGTYVSSCPTAGRVGRCSASASEGGVTVTITESYYSPTWDATSAQADCTSQGGAFTAG
jgi:hypothetical protein